MPLTLITVRSQVHRGVRGDVAEVKGGLPQIEECRQLLQRCLSREPSMTFDLLHITSANAPAPGTQVSNQLSWCVCNNCRDMPRDVECKCCGQQPEACISILPHMAAYILQEGHLRLASRIWNDVRGLDDLPNRGESSKQLRHAAYRQYVMWQYGALGRGHRVVIPSCVVWRIRDCFPDLLGHYTGYIPGRVQ
uniref:P2X purinoreceptor 7 intracellular domain-containing protein n=1 Tax=Gouania willdenowi TaxID=441366 RepID=A0A8C5E7Q6_GOUWI